MSATGSISWTCWHLNPIHVMGLGLGKKQRAAGKDFGFQPRPQEKRSRND
jgi:hypothetical protein